MTTRLKPGTTLDYAHQLQAAGFTIWVAKNQPQPDWFLYERDGYWGEFTSYSLTEGGPVHYMPIKPSRENGSSMFIEAPELPDPLTVEYAELVARPQNYNRLVGTQKNHPHADVERGYERLVTEDAEPAAESDAMRDETQNFDTADITAALRAADIDYRIQHRGTLDESILVTRADGTTVAFGPSVSETGQAVDGIDVAYYVDGLDSDVRAQDYVLTIDELVADLRRFLA